MSQKERALIQAAVHQRARAYQALFEDLHSGKNLAIKQGVLPAEVMDRALKKAQSSYARIRATPWGNTGFYYGPDIVRHPDGNFYFLEDNSGTPGGHGDSVEARRDLLEFNPKYQEVLKDGGGESFAKIFAQRLKEMAGSPDKASVIIVPQGDLKENTRLIFQLQELGVYAVTQNDIEITGSPYAKQWLEVINGVPYMSFEPRDGNPVKRIEIGAAAIRNFSQDGFDRNFPLTFKLMQSGRLPVMGYPYTGFEAMSDKELSIYMEKLIRFYLKEEPVIRYIPTLTFQEAGFKGQPVLDKAAFDKVFSQLDRYVIKQTNSSQGNGVWIGSKMSDATRKSLAGQIAQAPGDYIAQEYVPLSVVGDQIVDMRGYSVITRDKVLTSDMFWGRALSVFGDGRVNLSQKGIVIPIFFEGTDVVPEGSVTIPDKISKRELAYQFAMRSARDKGLGYVQAQAEDFAKRADAGWNLGELQQYIKTYEMVLAFGHTPILKGGWGLSEENAAQFAVELINYAGMGFASKQVEFMQRVLTYAVSQLDPEGKESFSERSTDLIKRFVKLCLDRSRWDPAVFDAMIAQHRGGVSALTEGGMYLPKDAFELTSEGMARGDLNRRVAHLKRLAQSSGLKADSETLKAMIHEEFYKTGFEIFTNRYVEAQDLLKKYPVIGAELGKEKIHNLIRLSSGNLDRPRTDLKIFGEAMTYAAASTAQGGLGLQGIEASDFSEWVAQRKDAKSYLKKHMKDYRRALASGKKQGLLPDVKAIMLQVHQTASKGCLARMLLTIKRVLRISR